MLSATSDRRFYVVNALVSSVALSFLAYLLLVRTSHATHELRFLPAINASLNATSALLLMSGWVAIRRGLRRVHQCLMVAAFAASTCFLVSYVTYHWAHGDTKFAGQGPVRPLYFFVLVTHILLSTTIVPMSLASFWFAWRKRFSTHRRIGRVLLPVWIYVSVTGVAIYFFLRAFSET